MPLPSRSSVYDRRWDAHHRPVATSTFTATCTITRPGGTPVFDPTTGKTTVPAGTVVYAGPCRVQAISRGAPVLFGGVLTAVHWYQVSIPYDAPDIHHQDECKVVGCDDLPLIGRPLRVVDVAYGSTVWQRDLICTDDKLG